MKNTYTLGIIFIHWGTFNKVAFGMGFFKNGKLTDLICDYEIVEKVLKTFIPDADLSFIKIVPDGILKAKITEKYWNENLNVYQNGIIGFEQTRIHTCLKKENKKRFFNAIIK